MLQSNEKSLVYFLFIPGLLSYDPRACFPLTAPQVTHLPNPQSPQLPQLPAQLSTQRWRHTLAVRNVHFSLIEWLYHKWTISMQDVSLDPVRSDYR